MFHDIVMWIVESVRSLGYLGIFFAMFLESSFLPFPSEVIMIPAGYLGSKGDMGLLPAILSGVAGSLSGALFNYWLAYSYGRGFIEKYGRYLFMSDGSLERLARFFQRHGEISTFSGRLIPGIRQYISLPAGLAGMNLSKFSIYTSLGAGIWVVVLTMLGYTIGDNEDAVSAHLHDITIITLSLVSLLLLYYILRHRYGGRP